jgi:hypothetical protein
MNSKYHGGVDKNGAEFEAVYPEIVKPQSDSWILWIHPTPGNSSNVGVRVDTGDSKCVDEAPYQCTQSQEHSIAEPIAKYNRGKSVQPDRE